MQSLANLRAGLNEPLGGPSTLRLAVVDRLRDRIVQGLLAPGTLLRETAIAQNLGVSATPVREAFGDLAAEGLIEIEAHRLKRVAPIDFKAMRDLFAVQVELWRLGYVWGIPHIGDAERSALDEAVAGYREGLARDDALGVIRSGHAFHTVFITASDNRELLRSTLDRRALIARFVLLHGRATLSNRGLRQHESILRALCRGDTPDVLARLDAIAKRLFAMIEDAAP